MSFGATSSIRDLQNIPIDKEKKRKKRKEKREEIKKNSIKTV
jgi:hypothetical protein